MRVAEGSRYLAVFKLTLVLTFNMGTDPTPPAFSGFYSQIGQPLVMVSVLLT